MLWPPLHLTWVLFHFFMHAHTQNKVNSPLPVLFWGLISLLCLPSTNEICSTSLDPAGSKHSPTLHFCRMKAARHTRRSLLGTNTTCWSRLSGMAKLSSWVLASSLGLGWSQILSRTEILTGLCKLISASRVTPWIQWKRQNRMVTYTSPEHPPTQVLKENPAVTYPIAMLVG